jgi:hypothetical protein
MAGTDFALEAEESLLDAVELEGDVLLQEEESGGPAAPEVCG